VVREGNDARANAQDHARVDLAVRVVEDAVASHEAILGLHRDQDRLLLLRVDELHQALLQQVAVREVVVLGKGD